MHVADIACGTGLTSLWMAGVVGPDGRVTAVDASPDQLRIAGQNAAQSGLKNISFSVADAYDTQLPRASFDLVYSRFLLCHLTQPSKAIDELRQLLKPGGLLVCEDFDSDSMYTDPPTPAYERLRSMVEITHRARGTDSRIGMKLPRLILDSGFPAPEVRISQPAYFRGREKLFSEMSLREAAPGVLAAGFSTPDEIDSLCAEFRRIAEDDSILLVFPRFFQVWARKP